MFLPEPVPVQRIFFPFRRNLQESNSSMPKGEAKESVWALGQAPDCPIDCIILGVKNPLLGEVLVVSYVLGCSLVCGRSYGEGAFEHKTEGVVAYGLFGICWQLQPPCRPTWCSSPTYSGVFVSLRANGTCGVSSIDEAQPEMCLF